jgi:transposase
MYITEVLTRTKKGAISHRCILLRQAYRDNNGKPKNRTIANLTHCNPKEVAALRLALKHKNDLAVLGSLSASVELREGPSVGSTWTVYRVAQRLGIEDALGTDFSGKLALWQVMARAMEQGSRLSAVRLAQRHAAGDILGLRRGFDENDLYDNLAWLADRQETIQQRLFKQHYSGGKKPDLYLYDVTSSYLEGEHNALSDFGYNRDGKRGKKQIVIGLLCDGQGWPLSIEVFRGNTQDPKTFAPQIKKVVEEFGGEHVTFVGDRGMIKSDQIKDLGEKNFHFITAITKPQIEKLLNEKILHMELFDEPLAEVTSSTDGYRYILRRNPDRASQIQATRNSKLASLNKKIKQANEYLASHPRAKVSVALARLGAMINRFKLTGWVAIEVKDRTLALNTRSEALQEEQKLDGCYVIKTDLPPEAAKASIIHERYKDLAFVERAFRTSKTGQLEMRPVYVRRESSTRGHALVVMLAYQIVRYLQQAWVDFDLTVEEGLRELSNLCSVEMIVKDRASCHRIPTPRLTSAQLLKSLNIEMPEALPILNARVVTRKKLQTQRKKG